MMRFTKLSVSWILLMMYFHDFLSTMYIYSHSAWIKKFSIEFKWK
ncbi:hypothetical protein ABIE05_004327 [Kosakonia cowanii]